ncbi:hypothetical protein BC830DRAFT_416550 [Chytriomyces sp. MP71]|nr:hypothetical protein BC830DRAFT_416550 [Chytriomyces sp. MP71]
MWQRDAQTLIDSGWVRSLCDVSDVIIVADTLPDARPLLLSLLEKDEMRRCQSNIVIELTNRFDWMVSDNEAYYRMIRNLTLNPPRNLWWTANNPFEEAFMRTRVGVVPNVTLLRSMGAWDVDHVKDRDGILKRTFTMPKTRNFEELNLLNMVATINDTDHSNRPLVDHIYDFYCMPLARLPKRYGGPLALLQYKAFLHIPYQTSVMKFYENVAAGVPQIIPSPRLLRQLSKSEVHHLFGTWLDKLEEASLFLFNPDFHRIAYDNHKLRGDKDDWEDLKRDYRATWTELSDFHRKEFEPFVYYFDSFAELAEMIRTPAEVFDWKNVRVEGPRYYARVKKQSLRTWGGIFEEMAYKDVRLRW